MAGRLVQEGRGPGDSMGVKGRPGYDWCQSLK
jgi:hypothetical protein